jgi:Ser/Thr protein kinase RdoA (MazF antagonist)
MGFIIEQLAEALWQCYGLRLERVERIDYGIWEEPFSVWTDRGRFFAKRFRRVRGLDEMQRGLALSQLLRTEGVPAPRVLSPREGCSAPSAEFVALHAGERYVVTEWVEGRTYYPGELPLNCARSMGALLGRLHRLLGRDSNPTPNWTYRPAMEAATACQDLIRRYQVHSEPFARVAEAILTEQIGLLKGLPSNFQAHLPTPQFQGGCFNSFWVEQLLFRPDGSVAALVDWTDGAGKSRYWIEDIVVGIHLSALDRAATAAYVAGYQAENPLPRSEWEALAAELTYGHLASVNFLGGWLDVPMRRMPERDATTELWHRAVLARFRERDLWLASILQAAISAAASL